MSHWLHIYQQTLTAAGRRESGCFSFEGTRLLERAVRAGVEIRAILAQPGFAGQGEREAALQSEMGEVLWIETDVAALVGKRDFGRIIGLADIPAPARWDTRLLLVAVDVNDPGNVGALVRTALASGASGFVSVGADGASDPFHPRAVRTSMGSVFKLPVHRVPDVEALFETLGDGGAGGDGGDVQCVGLTGGGQPIADLSFAEHVALCVGSEASGLSEEALARMTPVRLPMREGVDSFSVNAAAAIALYEVGRRL